jgi:hypothetical protein
MKRYLSLVAIIVSLHWAQANDPLAEKIERMSRGLVEGYTQPLITAFGTGISTGLFHSAYSHDFLGFDLSVRAMYIQIPNSARYFSGDVLVCSLGAEGIVCDTMELDSMSTVFGPKSTTIVPKTRNSIGIPPSIPGGFDVSYVAIALPQLNVGLFRGAEVAVRYMPFTYKGSRVRFLGLGFKQELTRLCGLRYAPVAVAFGGAYQEFGIKDSLGNQVVNSRTWNLQFLVSKRIAVFEPFLGVGLERTRVFFPYEFNYELPDTLGGLPTDRITVTEEIDVELVSQNEYRAIVGFSFNLGFFYLHYDYNIVPYSTHNAIFGISIR